MTGMEFDCCGIEKEEKRDEDGRDLKVGLLQRPPVHSGVPNRAEQLAGHGGAWNSTSLAQGSCDLLSLLTASAGKSKWEEDRR